MNIFVCTKQVPDTESKIIPSSDGNSIETTNIKWTTSPYDDFAIEQALLVKAKIPGATVTAIRVGQVKETNEVLRTAMAMGCDSAIHVDAPDNLDSYRTAKAIKGAIEKSGKNPDIIFCGKQAIDSDAMQVPQILATLLNLPSVTVIVGFEQNGNSIKVKREIEGGGVEIYELTTPAVFSCNKALNTPRYASLPGIMKAKKLPITTLALGDVSVTAEDERIRFSEYKPPAEKPAGKKFDAMDESKQSEVVQKIVDLLRNEAKIL